MADKKLLNIQIIRNYRKISVVAYLNILIIIVLEVLHERLFEISHTILFLTLGIYAVLNGIYVQRIISKQKKYEQEIASEKNFSNSILEKTSTGIVVVSKEMNSTEYINNAGRTILGADNENLLSLKSLFDQKYPLFTEEIIDQIQNKGKSKMKMKLPIKNGVKHLDMDGVEITQKDGTSKIMLSIEDVTEAYELNEKIEKQYLNMFRSFVKFIDAKDTYTGLHSFNVSTYVQLMLDRLDLNSAEKHDILVAANLHDIGKIGVPEYILNKPKRLTDDEFVLMKKHATIGQSLLNDIEGYETISHIIRHHHEKFDGNGYPDRLSGESIPLGSRIITVADAFDAITTDRVYQVKRSFDEAFSIMISEKGKQFDPILVDIFLEAVMKMETNQ